MKNNKILNKTRHGNGTRLDTQRNQFVSENMKKNKLDSSLKTNFSNYIISIRKTEIDM